MSKSNFPWPCFLGLGWQWTVQTFQALNPVTPAQVVHGCPSFMWQVLNLHLGPWGLCLTLYSLSDHVFNSLYKLARPDTPGFLNVLQTLLSWFLLFFSKLSKWSAFAFSSSLVIHSYSSFFSDSQPHSLSPPWNSWYSARPSSWLRLRRGAHRFRPKSWRPGSGFQSVTVCRLSSVRSGWHSVGNISLRRKTKIKAQW